MLDIIPLLSVISKIILSNCTSPLVTDDFLTAVSTVNPVLSYLYHACIVTFCVSTLRHTK